MQRIEAAIKLSATERKRVEAVVETLARLGGESESLAEVAHDTRNMVTALGLYCDLLEEPGVLTAPFAHYGSELRLVASASRRLVEKLVALDSNTDRSLVGQSLPGSDLFHDLPLATGRTVASQSRQASRWDMLPAQPIHNLAEELLASRNLLAALAGSSILLSVDTDGGAKPVRLTGEDLTRVLVNLVKNAAEALPNGGSIHLDLRETPTATGTALMLTVEDDGSGIRDEALENIFESGYTTRSNHAANGTHSSMHRGLGLSITRSILEAAGGSIHAANRDPAGARFVIELPVRGN